jgi:hypothetical protein
MITDIDTCFAELKRQRRAAKLERRRFFTSPRRGEVGCEAAG